MDQAQKIIVILPGRGDSLETVVKLLAKHKNRPYFAYEREDVWHLGLGSSAVSTASSSRSFAALQELKVQSLSLSTPTERQQP